MTIRKAKRNRVKGVETWNVRNGKGRKYLVVRLPLREGITRTDYFCSCHDFFCRRLPFLGTNQFSHCKHIKAVLARRKS